MTGLAQAFFGRGIPELHRRRLAGGRCLRGGMRQMVLCPPHGSAQSDRQRRCHRHGAAGYDRRSAEAGAQRGARPQPAIVELGRLSALRPRQRQAGVDGECRRRSSATRRRATTAAVADRSQPDAPPASPAAGEARMANSQGDTNPPLARDKNLVYVNGIDLQHRDICVSRRDRSTRSPRQVSARPGVGSFQQLHERQATIVRTAVRSRFQPAQRRPDGASSFTTRYAAGHPRGTCSR